MGLLLQWNHALLPAAAFSEQLTFNNRWHWSTGGAAPENDIQLCKAWNKGIHRGLRKWIFIWLASTVRAFWAYHVKVTRLQVWSFFINLIFFFVEFSTSHFKGHSRKWFTTSLKYFFYLPVELFFSHLAKCTFFIWSTEVALKNTKTGCRTRNHLNLQTHCAMFLFLKAIPNL